MTWSQMQRQATARSSESFCPAPCCLPVCIGQLLQDTLHLIADHLCMEFMVASEMQAAREELQPEIGFTYEESRVSRSLFRQATAPLGSGAPTWRT